MLAKEPQTESYEFRPDVVATVLEDGALLLDLETKYFYRLNETGWAIAQLFENGATLGDIASYARMLQAPASDQLAIDSLIDTLVRENLIVPYDGPSHQADDRPRDASWSTPTIERQAEPLQRVIISAFDPSVPLVE